MSNILENDNYNPSNNTKNTNKSDTDKIKNDLTNIINTAKSDLTNFINTTKTNLQQQITSNDNDIKNLQNKDIQLQNNINTAKNDAINSAKSYTDNYAIKEGFIYIQLRGTQTPDEIFKTSGKWQDISSNYAGEFFRAVGGASNSFGYTQAEGLPNINAFIATDRLGLYTNHEYSNGAVTTTMSALGGCGIVNGWGTDFIFDASRSSHIYGASTNVTPYNSAVRIWKKIA